jgi:hypothetical protein
MTKKHIFSVVDLEKGREGHRKVKTENARDARGSTRELFKRVLDVGRGL